MSFFLKFYVIFLTLIHPLQCSSPQSFIWSLFSSSKITNRQKFYESRNSRNIFRRLSFPTVSIPSTHPTLQLLHNRYHNPNYNDTNILGLAIEGGGMRGCVAAGAALALSYLNLTNCFDRIYGSSAGAMIGAYFISQQCQHAYDLYCNVLPDTKSNFIQRKHLFHEFYPEKYRSLYALLNLDFLLSDIMNQSEYSLDWKQFEKNEKKQKFSIIASDINSIQSIKLSRDQGNYNNKEELLRCIRASMLVPGVTGMMVLL